jgi:hypothetical protein
VPCGSVPGIQNSKGMTFLGNGQLEEINNLKLEPYECAEANVNGISEIVNGFASCVLTSIHYPRYCFGTKYTLNNV